MRRISIDTLKPGMKLSLPIRDENDNILLNRNVELTERYIQRLKKLGFQTIYISDPDLLDVTIEDIISDRTRHAAKKHLTTTHNQIKKITGDFKEKSVETIIKNLQSKSVKRAFGAVNMYSNTVQVVKNIVEDVVSCAALNGLNSLKTHDNYTFNHSIDVTIIAIMIGKKLKLDGRQLQELATGCLLHDLGKLFIPLNILNKKTKLTPEEFELVKGHSTIGYEMLKESVPIMPTHIAFQHHERQDGSGYPRGLRGNNTIKQSFSGNRIVLYGEITAIADVYDALSSDRPYRKSMLHDKVLDYIKDSSYSHFNAEIITLFLGVVPRYPVGSNCEVTSGKYLNYQGVITVLDEDNLNAPKIRLLYDAQGNRIEPIDVNLQRHFDIHIKLVEV